MLFAVLLEIGHVRDEIFKIYTIVLSYYILYVDEIKET